MEGLVFAAFAIALAFLTVLTDTVYAKWPFRSFKREENPTLFWTGVWLWIAIAVGGIIYSLTH